MLKTIYSLIAIVFVVALELRADCGCNKIKREEIEIVRPILDVIDSETNRNEVTNEVCSAPMQSQLISSLYNDMVLIPDGDYVLGTAEPFFPQDRESPERMVHLEKFYIDKYEVSNADFEKFVEDTKYVTYAERFGDSFVFQGLISKSVQATYHNYRVAGAPWWYKLNDTNWKQPEGDGSNINDRMNHPVVHVSWFDALAFCKWQEKRLPTEDEWEVACRGGKKRKLYPWGNKLNPRDKHWTNIWQGKFPDENTAEDGYSSTCSVGQFPQNDYDLYNIVGNVWEWTHTLWNGDETGKTSQFLETAERVKKGGSYLCHESYCYRYRCAARSSNTADSSAGNLGFRCART